MPPNIHCTKVWVNPLHLGRWRSLIYLDDNICRLIYLGDDICLWFYHPGRLICIIYPGVEINNNFYLPCKEFHSFAIEKNMHILSTREKTLDVLNWNLSSWHPPFIGPIWEGVKRVDEPRVLGRARAPRVGDGRRPRTNARKWRHTPPAIVHGEAYVSFKVV